jgi:anti-sigma factor RsiW
MTDDIHSQAQLYVIGALDPDETLEFETHLSQCPECQREVAEMRDVTAQLSELVAAEPPAEVRASVLAQIADIPQESGARAVGRHAAPGVGAGDESPEVATKVIPIRRSWTARVSAAVAAAAVVAAALVGGWAINDRNDARHDAEVASDQAAELARVLTAPDVQTAASEVTGGGTATVVRSESQDTAILVASDLPRLPSDKVYEAWTIDGDQAPVPAGTFTTDGEHTTFTLAQAAVGAGAVALSVEPTGGSDQPTTTPIVAIDLSKA